MTRPILASIDLQALKQNLTITRQAAPDARVWLYVSRLRRCAVQTGTCQRWARARRPENLLRADTSLSLSVSFIMPP